jgi:hypothetical protein
MKFENKTAGKSFPGAGLYWFCLGMKTETIFFGYLESFSKFYRNLGLNGNGNGYRKYGNGIGRKNWNRKRKRFRLFPTVSENYRFYPVFYRR